MLAHQISQVFSFILRNTHTSNCWSSLSGGTSLLVMCFLSIRYVMCDGMHKVQWPLYFLSLCFSSLIFNFRLMNIFFMFENLLLACSILTLISLFLRYNYPLRNCTKIFNWWYLLDYFSTFIFSTNFIGFFAKTMVFILAILIIKIQYF